MSIDKLSADDRALLREVFRAAHAKGWSRRQHDRDYSEAGSRYWSDDRNTIIELTRFGWLITPISDSECVTVQLAVDVLVAVGVLPTKLSSAYAAAVDQMHADAIEPLRSQIQEIKDVVGWFDAGHEERAISLRDQVWDLVTR